MPWIGLFEDTRITPFPQLDDGYMEDILWWGICAIGAERVMVYPVVGIRNERLFEEA